MPEITRETDQIVRREFRVNYHAVFAGVIIAMSLQLLLTILGNAIGISEINLANMRGIRNLTVGPVLWSLFIPLFCLLVGGFVAALTAKSETAGRAVLHGFLVWGLSVLFLAALLATSSFAPQPAGGGAGAAIPGDVFWLSFFSLCLSLIGALCGGYLGSLPLHRSVYRRQYMERRIEA